MEKLLKKYAEFHWMDSFQESLDTLKKNMVKVPILVFLVWKNEFHVHGDASSITLDVVLM